MKSDSDTNIQQSINELVNIFQQPEMNDQLTKRAIVQSFTLVGVFLENQQRQTEALERIASELEYNRHKFKT